MSTLIESLDDIVKSNPEHRDTIERVKNILTVMSNQIEQNTINYIDEDSSEIMIESLKTKLNELETTIVEISSSFDSLFQCISIELGALGSYHSTRILDSTKVYDRISISNFIQKGYEFSQITNELSTNKALKKQWDNLLLTWRMSQDNNGNINDN